MKRRVRLSLAFLLALGAAANASAQAGEPRVLKAHFTEKDQQVRRYVEVPFDVPAGTTRIDIELKYDKAGGANVVDLGLYEPGPLTLGTKAFRGWTGGERSAIFVSRSDATPGYWPGPIQAGNWNVGLGLYKVGASGVDVEVMVRTSKSDDEPAGPPPLPGRAAEPVRKGEAWYAGALHTHTWNSDGALPAQKLAEAARAAGLDFLAITDHNNTAHQRERIDVPGLLTIIGEEVTTPGGHMNVWGLGGLRDFIDFRVLPGDPRIKDVVRSATARGALVGINHPYGDCVACSWTHAVPAGVSTLEIVGRAPAETERAAALWDSLLREGRRVTGIGVSDWHRGEPTLALASVRVLATELSTRAILEGIRAGRVIVMGDATTPAPDLTLRAGAASAGIGGTLSLNRGDAFAIEIAAQGALYAGGKAEVFWNGELLAAVPVVDGRVRLERFAGSEGYVRVSLVAANGARVAFTNPVWIRLNAPVATRSR